MNGIGVYTAVSPYIDRYAESVPVKAGKSSSETSDTATPQRTTLTISSTALQLLANDERISKQALESISPTKRDVKRILDTLQGPEYAANRAIHNKEIPKTDDPILLDRAKQATAYLSGLSEDYKSSTANPFSGMSRDDLDKIVYDDSGTYTVNERLAARYAANEQEWQWRKEAVAKAVDEWNSTGKMTDFFKSALEHFKSLPLVERLEYPDNYTDELTRKIDGTWQ